MSPARSRQRLGQRNPSHEFRLPEGGAHLPRDPRGAVSADTLAWIHPRAPARRTDPVGGMVPAAPGPAPTRPIAALRASTGTRQPSAKNSAGGSLSAFGQPA